jgi:outer membrane lipoprotein SlyB
MKNDDEIVESLIAGGIIGAALGALLSKKNGEGSILGAIAGAAILATFKANEKARQTHVSMLVEENNALYEIKADGSKHFIRNIEKPTQQLPSNFKLK